MYTNKETFNQFVWSLKRTKCKKLKLFNIVFFPFLGLFGMIFNQNINTKEQVGKFYDHSMYQVVFRIIDGRLLMENKPDAYAWKKSKVESSKKLRIGLSLTGIVNFFKTYNSIKDKEERKLFKEFFSLFRKDMALIVSEEEARECVEVTQELYDAGLTRVINDWETKPKDDGTWETSDLSVGDYLIITDDGAYQVQRDVFLLTYSIEE